MDFKQHLECFNKILDNFHIKELLKKDRCGALCDKYHLTIVFQFFMRAEFKEEDYTLRNFFLALMLSHDMYDESKILKQIILTYYLSRNDGSGNNTKTAFHWDKLILFRRMQYKGLVERKICRKLCQLASHTAFDKNRREVHTGYITNKILCDKCKCPVNTRFNKNNHKVDDTRGKNSDEENSDNSKRPCNLEDVSGPITVQKAKRPKKMTPDQGKKLFFRDYEPELLAVETKSVISSC